jgi:hypothetical protein
MCASEAALRISFLFGISLSRPTSNSAHGKQTGELLEAARRGQRTCAVLVSSRRCEQGERDQGKFWRALRRAPRTRRARARRQRHPAAAETRCDDGKQDTPHPSA